MSNEGSISFVSSCVIVIVCIGNRCQLLSLCFSAACILWKLSIVSLVNKTSVTVVYFDYDLFRVFFCLSSDFTTLKNVFTICSTLKTEFWFPSNARRFCCDRIVFKFLQYLNVSLRIGSWSTQFFCWYCILKFT